MPTNFENARTASVAAAAAISSGDLTTARTQLLVARSLMLTEPLTATSSGTVTTFQAELKDLFEALDKLEADINQNTDNGRRTVFGRTNFS